MVIVKHVINVCTLFTFPLPNILSSVQMAWCRVLARANLFGFCNGEKEMSV